MSFTLTPRQLAAQRTLGSGATNVLLAGGSRSGKTFLTLRAIALRAIAAPYSRHAVMRFRFNHCKVSVVHDTWPKMLRLCFPQVPVRLDKSDWFAEFPNGSQVWFGGLDDKERTEKILGQEHVTLFFNEASQISYAARNTAMTRLAQHVEYVLDGNKRVLRPKAYYDCNPPAKSHWLYQLFVQLRDPDSRQPIDPAAFAIDYINPADNAANLPPDYVTSTLASLPARMRARFLDGKFSESASDALWKLEDLERWRTEQPPEMQRIVVAVDPSGVKDADSPGDAIGIVVAGLGIDGNAYVLEDLTLKAGPATWGNVATSAFDRWRADRIVVERNFGGEMVQHVIQTARPRTPCRLVTASRGKVARADPIAALCEQGKIRLAGSFPDLEDELCAFTTTGYQGDRSPNRADAMVWAMAELFPALVKPEAKKAEPKHHVYGAHGGSTGWMSG